MTITLKVFFLHSELINSDDLRRIQLLLFILEKMFLVQYKNPNAS